MGKGGSRAAAGRKVIPMNEKIAKGTFRKHREKSIPMPTDKLPNPPRWLNRRAKQIFRLEVKRIKGITIASIDHTRAISLLASRAEEVERLSKFIDECGSSYEKKAIVGRGEAAHEIILGVYARPEVKQRSDAIRHLHTLLLEFGLTPSSLGRVKPKGDKGKVKNEFEEF